MRKDELNPSQWQVAAVRRPTPDFYGIGSLVLAPLRCDPNPSHDFFWLLIRYRTPYPELSSIDGDNLFFSYREARDYAASQFGIWDSEWINMPASDVRWVDASIK
jgi:hypothetical protein